MTRRALTWQEQSNRPWLMVCIGALVAALSIWAIAAHNSTTRPNNDMTNVLLGVPDPEVSSLEEHLAWTLEIIDGRPMTDDEFLDRFADEFRDQVTREFLDQQLTVIAAAGPRDLYGIGLDPEQGIAAAALRNIELDESDVLNLATEPGEGGRITGVLVTPVESDKGPFTSTQIVLHIAAGLSLFAAAVAISRLGRGRSALLLATVAVLWLAQLLELSENALSYSAGLAAGPVAVGAVALALVALPSQGLPTLLSRSAAAAVTGGALGSLAPLLVIDTAALSLPDQLLSTGHNRRWAEGLTVVSAWLAVTAAAALAVFLLVRQFRADWNRERGLVATTFGGLIAGGLLTVPAIAHLIPRASNETGLVGYDLSQSGLVSVAAMVAAAGLLGTALWEHFDLGDVASQLAEENQELHAELASQLIEVRESRARIVKAGEDARRHIERNLHDGAQQRLLAVLLSMQAGRKRFADTDPDLAQYLDELALDLGGALSELRELSRGLHPAILDRGVAAATDSLAEASPVPVTVVSNTDHRCATQIEHAAYFVISEALANAARHAAATHVAVAIDCKDSSLMVSITDDGVGGASSTGGSGLQNLEDRVVALGGSWSLSSQPGDGTEIKVSLPCE